MQSAGNN